MDPLWHQRVEIPQVGDNNVTLTAYLLKLNKELNIKLKVRFRFLMFLLYDLVSYLVLSPNEAISRQLVCFWCYESQMHLLQKVKEKENNNFSLSWIFHIYIKSKYKGVARLSTSDGQERTISTFFQFFYYFYRVSSIFPHFLPQFGPARGWLAYLLRLQSCLESLILIGSAMFGTTFNLVTRFGLPYFLEHWKTVVWKSII